MDFEPSSPNPRWPRRLFHVLSIDRAVLYAILLRIWQLLAGAGTILLIARFFSEEMQGYYYLFATLVALQTFFELGLSIVVINVCSHEWARLRLNEDGSIGGDPEALSRLVRFGRLLFAWYGIAALLFAVAVGLGGARFLAWKGDLGVAWQTPWTALVIVSAWLLWTLPFLAVLEGCNQVGSVNKFRLVQAMLANVSVWSVMALGGGLWAAVAASSARLACDLYLLLVRYRGFFRPFWQAPRRGRIDWRREIWPLQWRLAVGGIFSYFAYFLFTPVMWHYHTPVVAGRMGMTWTIVSAIQAAALAWVQTRAPRFGMLIRQGEFGELDRLFVRVTGLAAAAMLAAGGLFWTLLVMFDRAGWNIVGRMLDPLPTAVFLTAAWIQLLANSLVFYVRAHKQEPFLVASLISNCGIGLTVWLLGRDFGPIGAGAGFLAVQAGFTLPAHFLIWRRCRKAFH